MAFKFKTTVQKFSDSPLWAHHIRVPVEIGNELSKTDRRILCSVNGAQPFHGALMHDGSGGFFINMNKELLKTLKVQHEDEIDVSLEKDKSKYGLPVPDFFEELCQQDPEGSSLFHKLTMGNQRNLLRLLIQPKSEQKQLEKALIIFDYLKSTGGTIEYKGLNEAFKNNRFRKI